MIEPNDVYYRIKEHTKKWHSNMRKSWGTNHEKEPWNFLKVTQTFNWYLLFSCRCFLFILNHPVHDLQNFRSFFSLDWHVHKFHWLFLPIRQEVNNKNEIKKLTTSLKLYDIKSRSIIATAIENSIGLFLSLDGFLCHSVKNYH